MLEDRNLQMHGGNNFSPFCQKRYKLAEFADDKGSLFIHDTCMMHAYI